MTTTPYELIFSSFIKRLKNDTDFFNYGDLLDAEIEALVQDHLLSLLDRSIGMLYNYGNPDVNFYDKNDELEYFNFILVNQEITLFADLMYLSYMEEDRNKLKVFELMFRSNELSVFSPANNRKTYIDMVETIEKNVINSISNYFSRDRLTWKEKSIYD